MWVELICTAIVSFLFGMAAGFEIAMRRWTE
jgi:hypothetical protein